MFSPHAARAANTSNLVYYWPAGLNPHLGLNFIQSNLFFEAGWWHGAFVCVCVFTNWWSKELLWLFSEQVGCRQYVAELVAAKVQPRAFVMLCFRTEEHFKLGAALHHPSDATETYKNTEGVICSENNIQRYARKEHVLLVVTGTMCVWAPSKVFPPPVHWNKLLLSKYVYSPSGSWAAWI